MSTLVASKKDLMNKTKRCVGYLCVKILRLAFAQEQILFGFFYEYFFGTTNFIYLHQFVEADV